MENQELQQTENKQNDDSKYLDIFPLKKGKRILVFLADFFIVLICAIFVFNIAAYPIARHVTNINAKEKEIETLSNDNYEILYDNGILFYAPNEQYIYTSNLNTTMEKFITYYISDNDAKDIKDESIHHYFCNIRNKDIDYLDSFYKSNNSSNLNFFDYENRDANNLPTLNETYLSEFKDYLAYPDENEGTKAESDYNLFYQYFFVNAYGNLMNDVVENDLTSPDVELSYNQIIVRINELDTANENAVVICAYISYFITIIILMVLIPFVTRRGKTPAHSFMRIERVQKPTLNLCRVNEKISTSFFYLIAFLPTLMFIPYPTFAIQELFSFSFLFIVSIIGLLFDVVSLIYLFFSKYNQTLSDLASLTILITSDSLDEVYRMKGYKHG